MGSIEAYETSAGKRYRVRHRTPDRKQTDKRGFTTKRAAELYLASVDVSIARGDFVSVSSSAITLGDWAELWLANQVQLKPSTRAGYETVIRTQLVPRWGTVSLSKLTHAGIQAWISEETRRVSPSTVRRYHRVLSMMLKFAIRDGRLSRNPADSIQLPRVSSERHGYLTHAQVRELADRCGQDGDVVLFLAYTGLRWGEMAALRVSDLDILRRRVNVAQAVTEVGRERIYGTPKNHGRRSVPFPAFMAEMLARDCEGKRPGDFVFTAPAGGALSNQNWRRRSFDRAVLELVDAHPDLVPISPHDLRHTAASLAISAGANVKAVQRMLGHASAAMTLDVYSDLFDDDLDAVGDALSTAADNADVGRMWARGQSDQAPVVSITK